jgi:DNA transformation protein
VVWLKADEVNAPLLVDAGSRQFTYPTKDGATMAMAYWSLPESAVDDPDEASDWARKSIDAALRKAAAKKPRKPKSKP